MSRDIALANKSLFLPEKAREPPVSMYPTSRRRRLLRGLVLYLAGASVLAVIGLVIEAGLTSGSGTPQQVPPTSLPTSGWTDATPSPSLPVTASPALAGPVRVVQGSQVINGVELGFPHTTAGAVSAADADMTEVGSTLDPDRAAAVMRMIADPAFTGGPQQAAAGAASDRTAIGLPGGGPVPAGASQEVTPAAYQVRDIGAGRVTVLLLSDLITTAPGQGTVTSIAVFPLRMHWAQGDWKMLPFAAGDYSGLIAEPGSPQAAQLGWQELEG
jgi:hypothetical protein